MTLFMERPFETLWKILFLILMELGARSGIVSQQDDEVEPHEQGEEEDLANDPEIEEQHESDEEHDHDGSDTSEVSPVAIPREPEEELNPNNVGDVNSTPDEPLPTHTADTHAMETGLDGAGNFHASEEVVRSLIILRPMMLLTWMKLKHKTVICLVRTSFMIPFLARKVKWLYRFSLYLDRRLEVRIARGIGRYEFLVDVGNCSGLVQPF